ncbi:ABC transporter permease [Pseudonocardia sp. GCM10023141]|uniref:ABC transporter permease n=1 Tax=Pseudonocardia sp. GCM10023141 TaxID=3252653 RepID=UPI003608A236
MTVRFGALLAFIAAWYLVVKSGLVAAYLVPPPDIVAWNLFDMIRTSVLIDHVGTTLSEAFIGYVLGSVVGIAAGLLLAAFPRVGRVLEPFVTMFNAVPRYALAPLFVIWFGFGQPSKIALVFAIVVFVVLVNTWQGGRQLDADIVTISRLLGASRWEIIVHVMVPSVVPWAVAGMRLSIAYALGGAVVGELFAGQKGVGYLIAAASGTLNLGVVFAGIVVIMIVAWLADVASTWTENRILRWRPTVPLG